MSTVARPSGERGTSVIELSVSMFIIGVVGLIMVAWMAAAGRTTQTQEDVTSSLDALREAKSQLVRELRFADELAVDSTLSNAHEVTIWIDSVDGGEVGVADLGEWITWKITAEGTLVRTTDGPDDVPVEVTRGLVFDVDGGPESSVFTYPAVGVVGIHFVAQTVDSRTSPQTIETQVRVRNQ